MVAGRRPSVTYLQFHLVFTLPWLALLGGWLLLRLRSDRAVASVSGRTPRFVVGVLLVHVLIALIYTSPWDNYLVARAVWGYPEGRVLFTIGFVPFEEYLFFVIQTWTTGIWLLFLLSRPGLRPLPAEVGAGRAVRLLGALAWLGVAGAGVLALTTDSGTYLGLILVWAAPVLALQWGFGGDLLLRRPWTALLAIGLPTVYLWAADRFAIGASIWWIEPRLTTGFELFGLPIEEAVFFLITNLLVVFGMGMALDPAAAQRLQLLRRLRLRWWQGALALWALSMVPIPLLPTAFPGLAYLSTGLLTLGVFGFALERFGRRAWALLAVAVLFGLLVEWLGHTTGVPFGSYSYTAPGPTLLGVPLLVPLGWFAFTLLALAVVPSGPWARLLAPAALVAWDLGLDPLMVHQGFWAFDAPGVYAGVPFSNFVGWYLAGAVLVTLLLAIEPRLSGGGLAPLRPIYIAEAFLVAVGLAYFGLLGPALVAPLAMALVPLLGRLGAGARRPILERS
jgi:putative membrane protein